MKSLSFLVVLFVAFGSVNANADRVRLLTEDKDALQARVDLVQQAKKEILAEYFSVWNDDQSVGGFALLLDAARRGIKVKVIMDALSNSVPNAIFHSMMENGKDANGVQNIEIKVYNPISLNINKLTHRDHSKMLIVDGEKMITGGRNIGDKYFGLNKKRNFSDLDIMLDGQAVKKAREDFLAVYESNIVKDASLASNRPTELLEKKCPRSTARDANSCEGRRQHLLKLYKKASIRIQGTLEDILKTQPDDIVQSHTNKDWLKDIPEGADVEFISHQADKFVSHLTNDLTDALVALVGTTKKDLNILSPYLVPTKNTFDIFEKLLKGGVRIRIITNSLLSTDNLFAQAGYLYNKEKLIKMGIEIYEFNGPNTAHGKAALIDNSVAFVGTYNLDPRSAFLNREVGILVKNSPNNQVAIDLAQEIEKARSNSLLVGKNGVVQNLEEQIKRRKGLSKSKRAALRVIRLFVPLFKNQI